MKILKITLQNINSLKSETPIEIDFQNKIFNDVGLYAITGATGAGKTTLLDAITIALYHQVPRFNNVSNKGLESVVSYGANDAFTSIVFENNNTVYEAYWGISLTTANGKQRSTPKEEVRLKDISNEKILAEKKREVKQDVEKITSLNYEQFLRSVMLAQGEFAAFLSAKGPEKAKLLEQITGEDIYKRVGETIQQKKAVEKRKLEDLKLTIDDKNILSEEVLNQKKEDYLKAKQNIEVLVKDEKKFNELKLWYVNYKKASDEKESLNKQKQQLEVLFKKHESELLLLSKNNLAEPFKENLLLHNEGSKELKKLDISLKIIEVDLAKNESLKKLGEKEDKEKTEALDNAEKTYKIWEPKLEKVAVLESNIEKDKNLLDKLKNEYDVLLNKKVILETALKKTKQHLLNNAKEQSPINTYLKANQHIPSVQQKYVSWTSSLTSIEAQQASIESLTTEKNKLKIKITSLVPEKNNLELELSSSEKKYEEKQKSLALLVNFFKEHNLKSSLKLKESLEINEQELQRLKRLSDSYNTSAAQLEKSEKEILNLKEKLTGEHTEIVDLEKSKKIAEESVKDAELILKQQQVILSYEEERKNLKKGEPCSVCGSTNHPFIENYKAVPVSELEKKLNIKKIALETINTSLQQLTLNKAKKETEQQLLMKLVNELTTKINECLQEKSTIKLSLSLSEPAQITKEINEIQAKLKRVKVDVDEIQSKQKHKETLEANNIKTLENITVLKSKVSNLSTKESGYKDHLKLVDDKLVELFSKLNKNQNDLIKELCEFDIIITKDEIGSIIKSFSEKINHYLQNKEKQQQLKEEQTRLNSSFVNDEKNLKELIADSTVKLKEVTALNNLVKENMDARNKILPENRTLKNAKEGLENMLSKAKNELKITKENLQKFQNLYTELTTQLKETNSRIKDENSSINELNLKIKSLLDNSCFVDLNEVKKFLLSAQEKERLSSLKKDLDSNNSSLLALILKNEQELKAILSHKKSELTEEEIEVKLTQITNQIQDLSVLKGALDKDFEYHNRFVQNNKEITHKIKQQEKELDKWTRLLTLIGGSKDAFNIYVQRLTLKSLIDLANIHLYKLNKRYSLQLSKTYTKGEELSFKLLDHYQAEQIRSVSTCSGGEKFLISLSLALGLSDLASNTVKIDSLFIDEGFGTLDVDTLETVMSTLENLQSVGKSIGIISHVESLKERIPVQIQLSKKGQGISTLKLIS